MGTNLQRGGGYSKKNEDCFYVFSLLLLSLFFLFVWLDGWLVFLLLVFLDAYRDIKLRKLVRKDSPL